MGKAKGNTIIIMLIFIFLLSTMVSIILMYNLNINKKINQINNKINENRKIELLAYEFYISDHNAYDKFKLENDTILYLENGNYKFYVYQENNSINIRRIYNND